MDKISELYLIMMNNYTYKIVAFGCLLLGTVSGILGCFAILRKQSLLGDVISHASLPGICLMYLIFQNKNLEVLLLGALISGIICIYIINTIEKNTKIKLDSILALILSSFFGLGLVLLSYINKFPGANKAGLKKFIFGQASTFTKKDINIIIIIGIISLFSIIIFWKEFKVVTFDKIFSNTIGISSKIIDIIILTLLILIIIVGIQAVGIILISALIISPGIAARQWTNKLLNMVILSGIFGGISGVLGTMISIFIDDLPTGPVIVIIVNSLAILSLLFSHERGVLFKLLYRKKMKEKLLKNIRGENE